MGFLCGSVSFALIWWLSRTKTVGEDVRNTLKIMNLMEDKRYQEKEQEKVKKPDNEVVARYSSNEYKRERAFLEEVAQRKAKDKKFGEIDYD